MIVNDYRIHGGVNPDMKKKGDARAGAAGVIFIDAVIRRNCNTNRFGPWKYCGAEPDEYICIAG
ncbi:hypothetical protein KD913_02170 [Klebsiella pneumoniae]